MASITSDTRNRYYSTLNVWETLYSMEGNYSDTYYELILYVGSNSFSGYTIGHRVKINNEEVAYHDNSGNQTSMSANSSKLVISGTKRIYHNSDGTKRNMAISFEIWTNNLSYLPVYLSASGTMDLTDIPRQANITRCDNFNSDSNPYMEFNNPGGFTCNLRLEFAGNRIERNGYSGYGGGYTFELSESERQLLYSACSSSNSLTVRYVVATLINGVETWWSIADKIMTVVNSNPTFSNCTYKDVGDESTKLTGQGNNQTLINGFNDLQVTISSSSKAVAKNGATMSRYRLVCGNKSTEEAYNSSSDVVLNLADVTNMTFTVYAIDSRGNSTSITKSVAEWKDYSPIKIKTGSATRDGGVGTETTLSFEGTLWNNSFGEVDNKIVTCQYKHKKSNESEYSNLIDINPTISGNTFSFSSTIKGDIGAEGFNVSNSFNIQVIVTDKIKTATYDILLGSGTPAMAIHRYGVAFGKPYDENEGGSCQVDGKDISKKNIMTIKSDRHTQTFPSSWTNYTITNMSVYEYIGNKLTFDSSNNAIKIGKKVSKVRVSANMSWSNSQSWDRIMHVFRNNTEITASYYGQAPNKYLPYSLSSILIAVQENDLIKLCADIGTTNSESEILSAWLTVEVVE